MIESFEISTEKNRVKLAIEKKTKVLVVDNMAESEPIIMKNQMVRETENAKILGYTYNNKGTADTHLENKETESIAMMVTMGITIDEHNMERIYVSSMLILYQKCFVHKMLYGLTGVPMSSTHWDREDRQKSIAELSEPPIFHTHHKPVQ